MTYVIGFYIAGPACIVAGSHKILGSGAALLVAGSFLILGATFIAKGMKRV